jgi:V/A-type H+/Na+-transporting ATPase subunit D
MQQIRKQLRIRQMALPTIKSKESALRMTVKKQKDLIKEINDRFNNRLAQLQEMVSLWSEFPVEVFQLQEVLLHTRKIAGVKTPELAKVLYEIAPFSRFSKPVWISAGLEILKELAQILVEKEVARKKLAILEYARKKTTQKVNLYEKVQIPEFSSAILKIKRFLEDVDNLEKAGQKITKQRQATQGAAA